MNAPAVLEQSYKGPLYFKLKVEETKEGGWEGEKGKQKILEMKLNGLKNGWLKKKRCGSQKEEGEKICERLYSLHPTTDETLPSSDSLYIP